MSLLRLLVYTTIISNSVQGVPTAHKMQNDNNININGHHNINMIPNVMNNNNNNPGNYVLPHKSSQQTMRGGSQTEPKVQATDKQQDLLSFLQPLHDKYPHQPVFLQSVQEMALSLKPLFSDPNNGDFYKRCFLLMAEPERILAFRVSWQDDQGNLRWNRGWRVEFNSALGPYKGGLRFHPSVDEGVLKFLGFEQIFKNALLGLPLGGGKGGSDFDPKGKSDAEIRRFCESFMQELYRYLHPSTDVPAGDIGVGGREIGYMYGMYKKLTNRHGEAILTGKSPLFGGSPLRPEATGFGLVYIAKLAIERDLKTSLKNKKCLVSGSGNVAQYACKKLIEFGAKVLSVSDSNGVMVYENGMTLEDWNEIVESKQVRRERLSELAESSSVKKNGGKYYSNESPWSLLSTKDVIPHVDFAFPCATQNEITADGAKNLICKGVKGVFEGANLPTTLDGQEEIRSQPEIVYIPGKAANAGGVGVSGFEMSQNAMRLTWKAEEVDEKLQDLMENIYNQMKHVDDGTLEEGANQAGFIRVANAMKELGWVY